MISSIAPQPPTAETYAAFQREWHDVSRPLIRHLVLLESFGCPRYLVKADGSFERLDMTYPDGAAELIADARRLLDELRGQMARSFGIYPWPIPETK